MSLADRDLVSTLALNGLVRGLQKLNIHLSNSCFLRPVTPVMHLAPRLVERHENYK
jgi:hypothetical protein